ncbi:hypothetical protein CYMTET_29385 [Cymbomonas tetramitiformis]|uniref:Uncharacterized protein n=1 Tax=Cymbomonas tetramitiformis TaxID=36881 RepID=A0AAE0KUZ3_9CHLO|nr:hypothetical protein CYMTET_29385 [Cymbomonas tetramitiformis]
MQRSIGSALRNATATARRISADSSRYFYRARCASWQLEHEGWNNRTLPFDPHMFEAQSCLKSPSLPFAARAYAKKAKGAKKDKKEKKEASVEASGGEEVETVNFPDFESLVGSSVTALEQELGKLRTGRAVPGKTSPHHKDLRMIVPLSK